jgi:phosphoglucosamine mutase
VLPTPAVGLLAEGCGAVVSASHNPPEYNGVKFFDGGGGKLSDADELEIEALLDEPVPAGGPAPEPDDTARERYADLVTERFGVSLEGLRIACDSANGAMSGIAAGVLERLGAIVTSIGDSPDGTNINVGFGATNPAALAGLVRAGDFDLGVALDGDGDRLLAIDAQGNELDGDGILAVLAVHLGVELVAVTTMTNLGFHRLMAEHGIDTVTTDVGDRYVLEALHREGGKLGGEQSGHIVWLDGHTTGDGLVGALLLARAVVESGRTLSDLASALVRFPQAQRNVPVKTKDLTPEIVNAVERVNMALGDRGRVLVRPSGTEPVVRVLAESETPKTAQDLCATIADLVAKDLS